MRSYLILSILLILGSSAFAQNGKQVRGTLQDSTGQSVISASVKLTSATDDLTTSSNASGEFVFTQVKEDKFTITVTSLGYETKVLPSQFSEGSTNLNLGKIIVNESSQLLQAVNIDGTPLIVVKEDTLEYRASNYQLKDGAVTEDLLKKLDGVEVDKNGNVTAQGQQITRVRINGKDFFGGDVQTATKNLPADVIEKIQIIDDYGDQANLTGNRTGDPDKILNIEIAPSKNVGEFGQFRAGGGTEDRYQATAMYNSFANTRQFSTLANLNNVNASLFDFNTQGGGARRGPTGGGGFPGGGGGGFGGNQSGLTSTSSIGVNYRKSFLDDKLVTYGNYSYSYNDNNTFSNSSNQYTYPGQDILNQDVTNAGTIGNNHRLNWNFEYKPSATNYFKLTPSFSYSKSDASTIQNSQFSTNDELTNSVSRNNSNSATTPNIGVSGLINHRLSDNGRNIFMNFSLNSATSETDRDEITDTYIYGTTQANEYQRQLIDLNNKRLNGGASLSYLEPLGKNSNMEFEYTYDFSNYDNNRIANSVDQDGNISYNPALSNIYDYSFIKSSINLNYRYRTSKVNYTIGASAQPSTLKGNTVDIDNTAINFQRKATNFAPIARFEYVFSNSKRLSFTYNGRPTEPGYSQLQPVRDISNPQFPVVGNPELAAEFSHNLNLRYNNFDFASGNSFFGMLMATFTNDKVVSNRMQSMDPVNGLVQETSYLNANGYYTARGFYNYSKPFLKRKYVVSLNGSANFNNNISFANGEENIAKNWVLSQGLNVKINPNEWLDVTPGINYSYNTTQNSINDRNNTNINTWSLNLDSRVYFVPTFLWGFDLSKMSNTGYAQNVDASPLIINTYVEKQFLPGNKATIRLQAYDLLNEQVNISRSVTENSTLDSRSNRLARYFMLTLSYKFQKFAGGSTAPTNDQQGPGGRPQGGFPGGPGGPGQGGGRPPGM